MSHLIVERNSTRGLVSVSCIMKGKTQVVLGKSWQQRPPLYGYFVEADQLLLEPID
jgi:hypothetical protein